MWEFRPKGESSYQMLTNNTHTELKDLKDTDPRRLIETIRGKVEIDEVEYSDAGVYRCTAENPASGIKQQQSVRLRVRGWLYL